MGFDASDENDSSSIDDDNVNQDTLAIAEQLKPQFDSIEEIDENLYLFVEGRLPYGS